MEISQGSGQLPTALQMEARALRLDREFTRNLHSHWNRNSSTLNRNFSVERESCHVTCRNERLCSTFYGLVSIFTRLKLNRTCTISLELFLLDWF
jgi:hypothetical protein